MQTVSRDRRDPNKPLLRVITGDITPDTVRKALGHGPVSDDDLIRYFDAEKIAKRGFALFMVLNGMLDRKQIVRLPVQMPINGGRFCLDEAYKRLTSQNVQ